MWHSLILAGMIVAVCFTSGAQASLTGSNVTGALNFNGGGLNFFDSANNVVGIGVPSSGFLNSSGATTVSISTTIPEFGYDDPVNNTIRADFGSSTLLINDIVHTVVGSTKYTFTDAAFAGQAITESSDTFPGGMTVSLSATTITINYAGTQTSGDYSAYSSLGQQYLNRLALPLTV